MTYEVSAIYLWFAFLHVEMTTHDATEDDDDQADVIYVLLMT